VLWRACWQYSKVFQWSGRITLETYILQFHLWLVRDAKQRLVYLPAYPLLNFLLATAVFLLLSNWLFEATVVLNDALLPPDMAPPLVARRLAAVAGTLLALYAVIATVRAF
jgi:N-acetylneuraminate 9-O-acetyltransferase